MKPFAYVRASGEREAIAALMPERGRVLPLAGGMDLLALMKDYIAQPERLVDVKSLDRRIAPTPDGGLRIGAAVTLDQLAADPQVASRWPALAHAAGQVGTPQIRHRGTVGGNLNQRPRCWYFRNEEFGCLKKGGDRCFAVAGENQYHAIFGDGPCHIVHPSSLAVPAVALGARVRLAGPAGEREVAAADYYQMPDRDVFVETVLAPNEILTHLILPPGRTANATYEVRARQSPDWPMATASVALAMNGATVRRARIVMGGVAPIPWHVPAASAALVGHAISEETATAAGNAAVAGAAPMSGNAYKIQIARTAVKRAILEAGRTGA